MGLSEREQQLLEELERGLLEGEKGMAAKAERVGNPAAKLIAGALVAVIGLGVLITGVLVQFSIIGVVGFLIMLAGLVAATSNIQLPDMSAGLALQTLALQSLAVTSSKIAGIGGKGSNPRPKSPQRPSF